MEHLEYLEHLNNFADDMMINDYAIFRHSLTKYKKFNNHIPFELTKLLNDYRKDIIKCEYDIVLIDKLIDSTHN